MSRTSLTIRKKTRAFRISPQRQLQLILTFFILGFLFLRMLNVSLLISDENYYFYAAHLLTRGVLPYRDYFFQHLPTQIGLFAILIKLFGFQVGILKFVHTVASAGTALLLYRLLSRAVRPAAGVLAAGLFLGSFANLGTTDYAFGVHEAVFLLVLSWYLLQRSPVLAGLALFGGLTWRIYVLPAALGFSIYEFLKGARRKVLLYLTAAVVPFLVLNLALFFAYGERFLTPVWRYHFLKFNIPTIDREPSLDLFLRNDVILMMFAAAATWFTLRVGYTALRRGGIKRLSGTYLDIGLAAGGALAAQLLFLLYLAIVFQFYFVTLLPFLAVLAALALSYYLPPRSRKYATPLVILLGLLNAFFYLKIVGSIGTFDYWDELVEDVRALSTPDETIFGSYVVTTLVALLAEREITDYQIDTNFQRYFTGLFSSDEATRVATHSAAVIQTAVVDSESGEIKVLEPFFVKQDVLRSSCKIYRQYSAEWAFDFNAVVLWDCGGMP